MSFWKKVFGCDQKPPVPCNKPEKPALSINTSAASGSTNSGQTAAENKFPRLKCPHCNKVYSIGVDASLVTMKTVESQSISVLTLGGRRFGETSPEKPALVGVPRGTPEHQKALIDASIPIAESIRKSLAMGQKEYWYCRECNQNPPLEFPGSWI